MAEVFLKRTLSGWMPDGPESYDRWQKQRPGKVYRAEVKEMRNYKAHCLFMVLLNEVTFPNQTKFVSARAFRRAVALAAGHTEEFMTLEGEIQWLPLPYDYEHLPDEADFLKAFGAAMTVCAAILGNTCPELEQEVARYANEQYGGIECPRIFRDPAKVRAA